MTTTTNRKATGATIFRCSAGHVLMFADRADLLAHTERTRKNGVCTCGRPARFFTVEARVTAHVCGVKCTSAVGPTCDCQCGGKNHGVDHRVAA